MVNTLLSQFLHVSWFYFCLSVFSRFLDFGVWWGYMYPMSILKRNPKSSNFVYFFLKLFRFQNSRFLLTKKNTTPRSFKLLTSKLRVLWNFVSFWNLTVQRSTTAYCNLVEIFAQLSSATRSYNILLTTVDSSFYFMSYWRSRFFFKVFQHLWGSR